MAPFDAWPWTVSFANADIVPCEGKEKKGEKKATLLTGSGWLGVGVQLHDNW